MPALQLHAALQPGWFRGDSARQQSHSRRQAMNNPPAACVLPGMRTHSQNDRPGVPGREADMKTTPAGRRRCWRPRRRRDHEPAGRTAGASPDARQAMAGAMQLAIGLLTASLDSPELEAWAVEALIPHDSEGLGDFMAGLHVLSELLLRELEEATGQPAAATLQRLAILAEPGRGTSFTE
jgi:hypothetical protein